ncbi:hydrogenase expression/formation protein [Methylomonas sp. MgM2]
MTSITLPIIGHGSQPAEEDGAKLDYLTMPEEMATYSMPEISFDLKSAGLAAAKAIALQLEKDLASYPDTGGPISLSALDKDNRLFIDELLGEGEVSAICGDDRQIQESVLAGVWRSQRLDEQKHVVEDSLEVGIIPHAIAASALAEAKAAIETDMSALPAGVMNAPPLVAEINARIAGYKPGNEAYIINLSLLPQTEQDLAFLEQALGRGNVTILSRGYGNCRITATATRHVWWVQYFNSEDTLILNTLEVSHVPGVACASAEDIADSLQRLREILKVYL